MQDSGYKASEIENARTKALQLDRDLILSLNAPVQTKKSEEKQMIFTINHDHYMCKKIKEVLKENQHNINEILGGETKLIVASRRNMNIASTLFAKSSFSREEVLVKKDQECKVTSCKSCKLMNIGKKITLWQDHPNEVVVNLDYRWDCSTDHVVYLFVCKLCPMNRSFYIGQTVNNSRTRNNGHRAKFDFDSYTKSALSYHMYKDHHEWFDNRLMNYDLGVIKSISPMSLDRCEDYYLELTKAHLSLNRYKVTQS